MNNPIATENPRFQATTINFRHCQAGKLKLPGQPRPIVLALTFFLLALFLAGNLLAATALQITTTALPNCTVGVPYKQTLTATGGSPPYKWVVQAGGLPGPLILNSTNGQITGIPTASGSWVFTYPNQAYIVVTDSAHNAASAGYTIMVLPAPNTYYTLAVVNGSGGGFYLTNTIVGIAASSAPAGKVFHSWTGATVANPLAATTSLVMPGTNVTVTATYATAPTAAKTYALTVVNGSGSGNYASNATVTITAHAAPTGQVFKSWTGAAVANPQSATTTLLMPAAAETVTATYAPVVKPLAITKLTLPNATVGTSYAQTVTVTGGQPPYKWVLQAGGLPGGLTLNATNGQITGMATAAGSWVFTYPNQAYIVVTDSAHNTAALGYTIMVLPAPNTYFTLTVVNGSGGGFYLTNTIVGITASNAPAGEVFQQWTGATVVDPLAANTALMMPGSNVTVTAVYGTAPPPPPTYPLTVVNGTPSGSFAANATVSISANPAPAGQVFLDWTGATVASPQSPSTTLVMTAAPVTVTANYGTPPPVYLLLVNNGQGSGTYTANTVVPLTAEAAPVGEAFASWSGPNIADPTAASTTMVMPAANTTVTANYGFAPPAITNVPLPVASHPRLWITPADLPRLQSWAGPGNPIYAQGLQPLAAECDVTTRTQFFPGGKPNPTYPDYGDSQGYTGLLTEQYMMVLAFDALIDPIPTNRIQYAQDAHDLMMYAINQASLGVLANAPFRDASFPIYNRAGFTSEAWPLTLDWLYNNTNAAGHALFSAQDKAAIRKVFLIWADACLNASTTGGDHPDPIGAMNNPVLLPGGNAYRLAANNYYQGHARLLTLMALSFDPADDPSLDANAPPAQLGNSLRSYILDATGAWLYQQFAMFGDPGAVETGYGLPAGASVGLANGGLPPEGMLYGDSTGTLVGELLALKTAGFADPALSGPQAALANNAPVWSKFVTGFISSLVPAQQASASESYLGLVWEFASYGDILELYATPDMVTVFGVLSLLDRQNNDLTRLNAERWFAINAVEGGAPGVLDRVQNPWTWGVQDSIFLFLLLDPSATTTDPRTNYPTAFYDPGQGRLIDRTDWSTNATMFDFRCSWESINHQQADANQFEFYRRGEWLTKGVANYDNNENGQSSDFHNTLTLQNWCTNGTPTGLDWALPFWINGSQWPLAMNNGDPIANVSVQTNYTYAYGNTTQLYNVPDYWNQPNAGLDILNASRSILWLKPDQIVIYDRATSLMPGLFKQFNLSFPTQPVLKNGVITTTTPGGQHLYITPLLPANATFTSINIVGALTTVADLEPCQYRMVIQDPSKPADERFLHVLQGANAGTLPETASLVQSTAGTAMDGAVFGNTVVLFVHDDTQAFNGVTYAVPAGVHQHYITGCTPNGFYTVASTTMAGSLQVTITPSASGTQTDAAGVLALGF